LLIWRSARIKGCFSLIKELSSSEKISCCNTIRN
jgi:hypothetical protein